MSNYFKQLPDLLYLDRENKEIRTYAKAKNLFRRIKLRSLSTEQLANFQFYNVIGGERPDQVAFKFYDALIFAEWEFIENACWGPLLIVKMAKEESWLETCNEKDLEVIEPLVKFFE